MQLLLKISSVIILQFFAMTVYSQGLRLLKGKVTSSQGIALTNATVSLKGKGQGAKSGTNGEFQLSVPAGNQTIVISYVGMKNAEISINDQTSFLTIVLEDNSALLDEVVVVSTGYQSIPKERATGSFGTVSKSQLEKPATNIASRIIGTTAGVQALRMDEEGNPFFQIRGLSTLFANQEPLVVVDGFPIQGNYNALNPNDVESITILKDAAASSIWGARAANGVIVVTTKQAKKGNQLKVEFSAFTRVAGKIDLDYSSPLASAADAIEYEKLNYNKWTPQINTGLLTSHVAWNWVPGHVAMNEHNLGFISLAQRDKTLDSLKRLDNKQQIYDLLLANPVTKQFNLNISSATERTNNSLSMLFERNQSNFKQTSNERYMLNYRSVANVTKWLDFTLNTMLQYNKFNNSGTNLAEIQQLPRYEMLANPNGSFTSTTLKYYLPLINRAVPTGLFPYSDWSYNPAREIMSRSLVNTEINGRVQAGLVLKPIKGLNFESRIQYENFNTNSRNLYDENSFLVRQTVNQAAFWNPGLANAMTTRPILNLPKGSILDQSRNQLVAWNFRNLISYNKTFSTDHELNFVGGTEQQSSVLQTFGLPRTYGYNSATLQQGGFPNGPGGTPANGNQNGTLPPTNLTIRNWQNQITSFGFTNTFSYTTDRFFSAFGNGAYTYKNKYTISGSVRADASNLITDDPSYRYSPFWSSGISWQIWKERFMRNVSFFDRLSLRMTYGYNGNVDRSTSFMPLISLTPTPDALTNAFTASFSSLGNPTLRWEKTGTTNLGVDYSIFKGKLFGKIDFYQRSNRDLIAQISIPAVNGSTVQRINNADMRNNGIELEMGTALKISKNLNWRGNLNFSYNNNKITKLFLAQYNSQLMAFRSTASYAEGYNANTLWMYKYTGFNSAGQPTVLGPGGVNYDMQSTIPGDGRTYMQNMGTLVAPSTFGFINNFDYKNLSFSFIITGNFGHVFQRRGFNYPVQWTLIRTLPNKFVGEVLNGKSSDIVTLPLNPTEPRFYFWDRFYTNLSYLSQSASWMRLQEVNITYRVPRKILGKMGLNNLQLYVQGNDLSVLLANDYKEDPLYQLGTLNPRPKFTFGIRTDL